MSNDMEMKLAAIAKIGDMNPEFVLWSGSIQDATKWERLIRTLADSAEDNCETGYDPEPLICSVYRCLPEPKRPT